MPNQILKNMKRLYFLYFILFLSYYAESQTVTLRGNIVNQDDFAIEFANILLYKSVDTSFVKGVISETDGSYFIEDVPAGAYFLEISQIGYKTYRSEVISLKPDGSTSFNMPTYRIQEGIALEEVMIRANKPLIELEADKVVVNVANSSVEVGNTALEVLQKSPGVTVDQDNRIALKGKQGVLILIDGKNQYVSNEQLSRLLETMPSNSIDKIEIMHNPSSKYDASGNAGVINIKLKKKENTGTNGTLTLGLGQGQFPKANGGISLNHRTEKINLYGNYDYRYWKGFQDITLERKVPVENGLTLFDQKSNFENISNSHNYKVGTDIYLSEKTTIGILGRGSFGNWDGDNFNHTDISGVNPQTFDQSNTNTAATENWDQFAGNFNVMHQFNESADLNFDVDYSSFNNPTNASYDNFFFDENMNPVMDPFYLRNQSDIGVDIFAAKLDISKSFSSGIKIDIGAKFSDVLTENHTLFENLEGDTWNEDLVLTNAFNYDEEIIAGYFNASKTIGKLTVQAGLRLEHTNSDGFSVTLDERVTRSYSNLFPSLSISHQISDKHSVSYSYSRRLDRPTYKDLNPFINFLDQFTFEKGNPFLNPQLTNSYGINYGMGRSLFISLNYSRTTDAMTEVIEQNDITQQTFQTTVNLDKYENYSLNITAPIVLSELWTTRLSFTGFINDFESELASGSLNKDQQSYHANVSNELSINKKLSAEVSGWYRSSIRFGIFVIEPMYSVDLGLTLKVLDGQGNIKLSAKDILGTMHNEVIVKQDNIDLLVNSDWESQRVNLAFSYNFGNQKVKKERKRRTANSDEEDRVSRNN